MEQLVSPEITDAIERLLSPEAVAGIFGGLTVAVTSLLMKGVLKLKSIVMATPTTLDDRLYNAIRAKLIAAGEIPVNPSRDQQKE